MENEKDLQGTPKGEIEETEKETETPEASNENAATISGEEESSVEEVKEQSEPTVSEVNHEQAEETEEEESIVGAIQEEVEPEPVVTPEEVVAETTEQTEEATEQELPEEKKEAVEETPVSDNTGAEVAEVESSTLIEEKSEEAIEEQPVASSESESSDSESEEHSEDEEHEDDEHEDEHVDYSNHSKEELLKVVADLSHSDNFKKADRELREITPHFHEYVDKEREEAYQKFIADGGEADGFEYKDVQSEKFEEYSKIIRERKSNFFSNLEKEKDKNLILKNDLLEKLRELVDGEESTTSINALKELQDQWKAIGPVPGQHNRTLWANYNALIDRFYDNRSIYFELKELDRKKNLDGKLALCEKAEELVKLNDIREATKLLNELHEEFKHIGPIPKEDQEPVWQRFKAASDAVYANRRDYVDQLKASLKDNLDKKMALVEEVKEFETFDSDRINEWNAKTKEILDVQKKWEAIGGIPRDRAKVVNKSFWGPFKHFFHNKGQFFKKLEGQREENLEKKKVLVEQAQGLKDSQDWHKTAEELKKLQQEWRNVGPVPEKVRNEIFEQFKKACDYFFDQKRAHDHEAEKEFYDNLKAKEEVCEKLNAIAASKNVDTDEVYDLLDEFADIGFVPRKDIKKIKNKFDQAVKSVIANADNLDEEEKEDLRINLQVNKLKSGPNANRKLNRKEHTIKRKISNLENDISTWKNNLQFFANSKKADALKADFEEKVEKAQEELEHLRRELQVLHQA